MPPLVLVATTVARALVGAHLSQQFSRINYEASPRRRELDYWSGVLSSRELTSVEKVTASR